MLQRSLLALCIACFAIVSCKHNPPVKPPDTADGNYPPEVAKIIVNKCATAGCHNAASYEGAGGLRLDTWDHLFDGGNNGAVVVAYDTTYSSLLYFINTDSSAGLVAQPTMPQTGNPLSKDEYNTIRHWIAIGAPDKNGNIPFASNSGTRQKIYVTMQACDMIGVIDAEKRVMMRYIHVGTLPSPEIAHCIRTSADGQYAYVSFTGGNTFQKIETATDKVVDNITLPTNPRPGTWNVFNISPDGTKALISDWSPDGRLVLVDLITKKIKQYGPGANFNYPHGIASNPTFDTFYIVEQYGNAMCVMDIDGFKDLKSLDSNTPVALPDSGAGQLNPHEIVMAPDYSRYFVTCQKSGDLRVMRRSDNKLLKVIPLGSVPQEIAISKKFNYIFVSCMEDQPHVSGSVTFRGTVYVIKFDTVNDQYDVVKVITGNFSSIHGLTVDDKSNTLFFASRNVNTDGPAPHHTSNCGGKNGYYNAYDITTFLPAPDRRYEVLPDPYSMDVRFK